VDIDCLRSMGSHLALGVVEAGAKINAPL